MHHSCLLLLSWEQTSDEPVDPDDSLMEFTADTVARIMSHDAVYSDKMRPEDGE